MKRIQIRHQLMTGIYPNSGFTLGDRETEVVVGGIHECISTCLRYDIYRDDGYCPQWVYRFFVGKL